MIHSCKYPFVDIHCHQGYKNTSQQEISIVNIRLGIEDMQKTFENCSIGIHPWDISLFLNLSQKEVSQKITSYLLEKKILAIGEIGFDLTPPYRPFIEEQKNLFLLQTELAMTFQLPIILHIVKAYDLLLHILKKLPKSLPIIIHGFRGQKELIKQLIKRENTYISFGKYYHIESLQLAYQAQRVFFETDQSEESIATIYTRAIPYIGRQLNELKRDTYHLFSSIFSL